MYNFMDSFYVKLILEDTKVYAVSCKKSKSVCNMYRYLVNVDKHESYQWSCDLCKLLI